MKVTMIAVMMMLGSASVSAESPHGEDKCIRDNFLLREGSVDSDVVKMLTHGFALTEGSRWLAGLHTESERLTSMLSPEPYAELVRDSPECVQFNFFNSVSGVGGNRYSPTSMAETMVETSHSLINVWADWAIDRAIPNSGLLERLEDVKRQYRPKGWMSNTRVMGQVGIPYPRKPSESCFRLTSAFTKDLNRLPSQFNLAKYRQFAEKYGFAFVELVMLGKRSITITSENDEVVEIGQTGDNYTSKPSCANPQAVTIVFSNWNAFANKVQNPLRVNNMQKLRVLRDNFSKLLN